MNENDIAGIDHHCKHCQKLQYEAGYSAGRADVWKVRRAQRILLLSLALYLFFLLVIIEGSKDSEGRVLRFARDNG